jgi:hypothetical protein
MNVRRGLWYGVVLAVIYSGIAIALRLIRGDQTFAANETTLLQVVGAYWLGGVSAGLIAGLC